MRGNKQIWWTSACIGDQREESQVWYAATPLLKHCVPTCISDPDPSFQGWPSSMKKFCSVVEPKLRLANHTPICHSNELTSTKLGLEGGNSLRFRRLRTRIIGRAKRVFPGVFVNSQEYLYSIISLSISICEEWHVTSDIYWSRFPKKGLPPIYLRLLMSTREVLNQEQLSSLLYIF